MKELLCHLFGDYIIQTNKQALEKRKSKKQALIHAATYTLPFLLLTRNPKRLAVIFGTHAVIDHYGLARFVVQTKKRAIGRTVSNTRHRPDIQIQLPTG